MGNKREPCLRVFKKSVIIFVNEYTKKFYGMCINFCFLYLHMSLIPQFFVRKSHVMLLELCLCVVIFKTGILNAQYHITLTALPELFFVTPLALQTQHLSCVSDGVGQCLLPQTSSLTTRLSN